MSDFVQTMKDWRRMCQAMEKERPNDACSGCRLEGYGCPAIYEDNSNVDFADVDKNVTAWAAEHPVVYPTWCEWLTDQAVMVVGERGCYGNILPTNKIFEPIPADIAQKLGIEPKEG